MLSEYAAAYGKAAKCRAVRRSADTVAFGIMMNMAAAYRAVGNTDGERAQLEILAHTGCGEHDDPQHLYISRTAADQLKKLLS